MKVSISSRIKRALMSLSLLICCSFSVFLFLFAYILEDEILIRQLNAVKQQVESSHKPIAEFNASANVHVFADMDLLSQALPFDVKPWMLRNTHYEYFDDDNAFFISKGVIPASGEPYYILYDVTELLVVRDAKMELLAMILAISTAIFSIAIFISHWLSKTTLSPVKQLTSTLDSNNFEQLTVDLAKGFKDDEVGVLARSLADAITRSKEATQREFEFNQGVSHELRSPIQVASSATELLELQTSGANKKYVARLKRSITEMNETVEAFLWLTSQRSVSATDTCTVSRMTTRVEEIAAIRPNCHVTIRTDLNGEYAYPIPQNIMLLILKNLVNNAIAHGDSDRILLVLNKQNIRIANPSIGYDNKHQGFGLGLIIIERICERFNIQLEVQTEKDNVFSVNIVF